MNRQNNLKIIISTVIVLIISAIAIFTVVNWSEIVKKFQGAASKADGIEKHERNTVPPTNSNTVANKTTTEEWKDVPPSKDDPKLPSNTLPETNTKNLPKFEDNSKPNTKSKDSDPYGLDEPQLLKKDSVNTFKMNNNEEYPMGNETELEKKTAANSEKSVKMSRGKKHIHKKYRRKPASKRTQLVKIKKLDKRVTFLEKKLGVKDSKKKPSLEKRIYRLEKIITKKKK